MDRLFIELGYLNEMARTNVSSYSKTQFTQKAYAIKAKAPRQNKRQTLNGKINSEIMIVERKLSLLSFKS